MKEQKEVTPEEVTDAQELAENPIITLSDVARWPLLEVPSQECSFPLTDVDFEQLEKMNDILVDLGDDAAGLAAVQVGYPRQIFLLNEGDDRRAFINPRIVSKSKETKKDVEGCLSLPGVPVYLPRPKSVTLEYYDVDGERHEETFTGFWARCVMHEMAHLEGRLIIDEAEAKKTIPRSSFGMKLDVACKNRIAKRRKKNKRARKARRQQRISG